MKCPEYVRNCIKLLEESGHSAYAVGGAVRDSLLGLEPSDFDVTTSALPDEIFEIFSDYRRIPTGIKHGTVTVLFEVDGTYEPIEITTYRIDGAYRDSRHPERVEFTSRLCDDLARRDFTINALAFNEKEGIIDEFGGRADLENGIIRCVGDPETRFSEDALRILRAFRFSSQLGFKIEYGTLQGAKKCSHLLKNIARERVGAEFKRLLASRGASYSLREMIECGVWGEIFDTNAPSFALVSRLSELRNGNFSTRLAVIITDYSEDQRTQLLSSLRLSNDEKKLILRLCRIREFDISAGEIGATARRFLHLYGDIYESALELLVLWHGCADFARAVEDERIKRNPLRISDLAVRGEDILPLCKGDHKKVGLTLSYLLERVIEDPSLNTREALIEIAKKNLV